MSQRARLRPVLARDTACVLLGWVLGCSIATVFSVAIGLPAVPSAVMAGVAAVAYLVLLTIAKARGASQ